MVIGRRARPPSVGALLAAPGPAARRHLPGAGHARVRAHVRQRARAPSTGSAAARRRSACPARDRPVRLRERPGVLPVLPSSSSAIVSVLVDPRAPGHDRHVPRRAARERDRGRVDRHQPGAVADHRLRAVGRHRRARRRPARHARGARRNYAANFQPFLGLFWVVLVVTLGARTVEGAVSAGHRVRPLPEHPERRLGVCRPSAGQFILFGLGAITYAKHPEGIIESQKRGSRVASSGGSSTAARAAGADGLRATPPADGDVAADRHRPPPRRVVSR